MDRANPDAGSLVERHQPLGPLDEQGGSKEALSSGVSQKSMTKEWTLTSFSGALVLSSLFLLPSEPLLAVLGFVLFGYGLIYFPMRILERRRLARAAPLQVGIVGGVPIRSSRSTVAIFAGWMFTSGIVGLTYFSTHHLGAQGDYVAGIVGCAAFSIFAAYGCYWLVGIITGRWPNEFVQFDPLGITIGRGRWSYTVPWDNIVNIGATELYDNVYVLIFLDSDKSIIATPGDLRRVSKDFARNRLSTGASVVLNAIHFGLDARLLVEALRRYVTQPSARTELARRQIGLL
jgi:hypothetical protein